jgi:hypothetical protein
MYAGKRPQLYAATLFIAAAAIVFAMYWLGRSIRGPFIFADESVYFSMARDVFLGRGLGKHTQYGPLFAWLTAPLFNLAEIRSTYYAIRFLNTCAFISSAIPVYLLARKLFPSSGFRFAAPLIAMALPYGAFAYLVWAEPLFTAVLAWSVYFFYRHSEGSSYAVSLMAGVSLGMLFLLKPAGLFLALAAGTALVMSHFIPVVADHRRLSQKDAYLLLSFALVALPWIARNIFLTDGGPLGYPGAQQEMRNRISEIGHFAFVSQAALSLLYQLSYLVAGSWGFAAIFLAYPVLRARALPPAVRISALFLAFGIAFNVAVSAVHMTSYLGLGYHVPNGRYYCFFFPYIILFASYMVYSGPDITRREVIATSVAGALLSAMVVFFSPLLLVVPYSAVNNPELSMFFSLFDGGFVWRRIYDPSWLQRIGYGVAIFVLTGLLLIAARHRRWRIPISLTFAVLISTATIEAHRYAVMLGSSQESFNILMRWVVIEETRGKAFAFDPDLLASNAQFIYKVWADKEELPLISPADVAANSSTIDFYITKAPMPFPLMKALGGLNVYEVSNKREFR